MTWSSAPRGLVGIISDNLTGATATGILMTRHGFKTATSTGLSWPSGDTSPYSCVCINTESRAVPPLVAAENVTTAARLIIKYGGRLLAKCIDASLRGNLGAEIEAVLAALGPDSLAVVSGAFPASGRVTLDGNQYVHGVLLSETLVRQDPLSPVTQSHIPTLLAGQTKLPAGLLGLETVRTGTEAVAAALKGLAAEGVRVVCADGESDDDIAAVGAAMVMSGLACVAVDPGPLTSAYVSAVMPQPHRRTLVMARGLSAHSRQQLEKLQAELGATLVEADATALAQGGAMAATETERVARVLSELPDSVQVMGVRCSDVAGRLDARSADAIIRGLADVAARVLAQMPEVGGVYTNGGDLTQAICRRLGAGGIEVIDAVMPLAVCGRLMGGSRPGMTIVTKGGLVDESDAAVACVRHVISEVAKYT